LSCNAPTVPAEAQGQFAVRSVNTFAADIQYQGMVVWVQKNRGGANSLPLETERATIYQPVPFGKPLFVNISVQEATATKMTANCTVYDEKGDVYVVTEGAAVTVSEGLKW